MEKARGVREREWCFRRKGKIREKAATEEEEEGMGRVGRGRFMAGNEGLRNRRFRNSFAGIAGPRFRRLLCLFKRRKKRRRNKQVSKKIGFRV